MISCQRMALGVKVQPATVLVFSETEGGSRLAQLSGAKHAGLLVQDLLPMVWEDVCSAAHDPAWLAEDTVSEAEDLLYTYRLREGAWDKALYKPSGFCRNLFEFHWTDSIVFSHRFSVWGWAETLDISRAVVIAELMCRARERGVVADAAAAKKITKALKDVTILHEWLDGFMHESQKKLSRSQYCSTFSSDNDQAVEEDSSTNRSTDRTQFVSLLKAPCMFELMKWKANEFVIDGLKWRA